jgi:hypothetical protein
MRWNIIMECVGEDRKRSTITLGSIDGAGRGHVSPNLVSTSIEKIPGRLRCLRFERNSKMHKSIRVTRRNGGEIRVL